MAVEQVAAARELPSWLALEHAEEDAGGPMTVPDHLPDWLLDAPHTVDLLAAETAADVEEEQAHWVIPGQWGDEPTQVLVPPVGPLVAQLQQAVAALTTVHPVALPGSLALVEAEALQRAVQQLRVLLLPRLADVQARRLVELGGFHGIPGWLQAVAPDAIATDRALARRLVDLPVLEQALGEGRVSLSAASQVARSLRTAARYLDQPDGLIDGQPGEEVVAAVIDNTVDLVCQARGGADERFVGVLEKRLDEVREAGGSQRARVEGAFVVLAEQLTAVPALKAALEQQVVAIVPNLLEQRQRAAEERRGAALRRHADGSWELEGRLTPECGERLFAALAAEARRDPANPVDTLARQHMREEALGAAGPDPFLTPGHQLGADGLERLPQWEREALAGLQFQGSEQAAAQDHVRDHGAEDPAPDNATGLLLVPRSRSRRLHDALDRLLTRYLGAGLGGTRAKVPVQASVTLSSALVEGRPGAPPGRGASGGLLARSLLKRWWEDCDVTTLLLDRGWRPVGTGHSGRTLTATEMQALLVQYGNRCVGVDCCPGEPDPLIPLVAHHVKKYADHGRTVLAELLPLCERLHQDLHLGKRIVRLRDGRLVTEDGVLEESG